MTRQFNVLIVEDEVDLWANPMRRQLQRQAQNVGVSVRVDLADTAQAAREYMAGCHYHFVSLDQHLPGSAGDVMAVDEGVRLAEYLGQFSPLTRFCAFTGRKDYRAIADTGRTDYREVADISRGAFLRGADVWFKGAGDDGSLSARTWAEKVLDQLCKDRKDHLCWSFERARSVLPVPLAVAAQNLWNTGYFERELRDEDLPQVLQSVFPFWEYVLRLIWLVSLAAQGRKPRPAAQPPTLNEREKQLPALIGDMLAKGLYAPYAEVWRAFPDASRSLRDLRNRFAHSLNRDLGWREGLEQVRPSLELIMDAAACWAAFPFIRGLQIQEAMGDGQHRARAQALRDTGLPWPMTELLLAPGQSLRNGDEIHAVVSGIPETGYHLLPMKDYLWAELHPRFHRQQLFAYSHTDTQGRDWKLDLETGQPGLR